MKGGAKRLGPRKGAPKQVGEPKQVDVAAYGQGVVGNRDEGSPLAPAYTPGRQPAGRPSGQGRRMMQKGAPIGPPAFRAIG